MGYNWLIFNWIIIKLNVLTFPVRSRPEQNSQNNSDDTKLEGLKIFLLFWHHFFSYLYTQTELTYQEILFFFFPQEILLFSASIIYYLKRLEVKLNGWCVNSGNVLSALINLSVQKDLLYFSKNKIASLLSTQTEWIISAIWLQWLPDIPQNGNCFLRTKAEGYSSK